ncbi:AP-1 complex subunit sigma-2 [Cucumis melo var. makuwa]|uniref:Adaptor AP-1 19 kDa protein n=2 Tax=Cucumis melo TaxID=3656 RepID=A0A5D3D5G1_CUCMM|nr:AP-1 complex subunit sigma-2 [Cucumis melo var. makuwa]TYK18789.1 AP-1 complex subunit sigma-2 [Cucumis melo var. makuwa]
MSMATVVFLTCVWIPLSQLKAAIASMFDILSGRTCPMLTTVPCEVKLLVCRFEELQRGVGSEEEICSICLTEFTREHLIHFVLLISRQGKVRLTKWYSPYSQKERSKVIRELSGMILNRGPKLCNFVEWRGLKAVYKRYASLYFCMCIDQDDNELEVLEIIHHYVEILDRYFGSVCELDLIFNFHKAYYILDELLIAGELQESSKKTVARLIAAQDSLVETAKEQASSISNIIAQATK